MDDGAGAKWLLIPGVPAGVGFALWLCRDFLRQLWADRKERAKGQAEVNILETAIRERNEERERAEKAIEDRNKAYEEVWNLRGKLEALTKHVETLEQKIDLMQHRIETLLAQIQSLASTAAATEKAAHDLKSALLKPAG